MSSLPEALRRVLPALRCPVCAQPLAAGDTVRCGRGHAFDLARQGYLNLVGGRGVSTGDTPAMVAARVDVFAAGVLDAVVDAVVDAVATGPEVRGGLVLDLAGGTGHYLASVLDHDPDAAGICLDASTAALRRAARAHPRAAAIGGDAWTRLPLADSSVAVVLSVFGPRDATELRRVLAPDGRLVVASPAADHLAELVGPLGLVRVDPRKQERQAVTFADFRELTRTTVRTPRPLGHDVLAALVGMGPSASHLDAATIAERCRSLAEPVRTTVAVEVTTYAP